MADGFLMDWMLPVIRQDDSRDSPLVHAVGAEWHRVMCAKARRKVSPGVLFLLKAWRNHLTWLSWESRNVSFMVLSLLPNNIEKSSKGTASADEKLEWNRFFERRGEKIANSVVMCNGELHDTKGHWRADSLHLWCPYLQDHLKGPVRR